MDIEQTDKQANRQSKTLLFQNKEILLPLITAVIATYIHFWGYAYLKGKLQMVGLGDIEIELSILESVYQASFSFRDIVNGVIGVEQTTVLLVLAGMVIAFLFYTVSITLADYFGGFIKPWQTARNSEAALNHSLLKSIRRGAKKSVDICAVYLALVFLFFIFAATSSLLLNIPRAIGQATGESLIENPVCNSVPIEELSKNSNPPCTIMITDAQNEHTGIILFKNSQYTVLITNQKSILLDQQNKIIAESAVFK